MSDQSRQQKRAADRAARKAASRDPSAQPAAGITQLVEELIATVDQVSESVDVMHAAFHVFEVAATARIDALEQQLAEKPVTDFLATFERFGVELMKLVASGQATTPEAAREMLKRAVAAPATGSPT
jgi:hypothetical protein